MFKKFYTKLRKAWYFYCANPVLRKGESGGYKWRFRKFWLEIETLSGNFKVRFTASEHPYGYLIAGEDNQTHGFAERMYLIGMLLTTDQKFIDDIDNALKDYEKRLGDNAGDADENEDADIAEVKSVQKFVDASPSEKRKMERDSDVRFKKVTKNLK